MSLVPQEVCPHSKKAVAYIKQAHDIYSLYQEMNIGQRFLYQCPDEKDASLLEYLSSFRLNLLESFIQNQPYSNDFKLKHFIHLFEGVESVVSSTFIQNIPSKVEISTFERNQFTFILNESYQFISPIRKALTKLIMRQLIHQNMLNQNPLLKQLFSENNQHLFFGCPYNIDPEIAHILFSSFHFSVENAYDAYIILSQLKKKHSQSIKAYQYYYQNAIQQEGDSKTFEIITKDFYYAKDETELGDKFIEEFFIVGEDLSQVVQLDLDQDNYVDSKYIYMFREQSSSTSCFKRNGVRKYCFPSGVKIRRIREGEVLGFLKMRSKNSSFSFKINNQDEQNYDPSQEQHLNCICILVDQLLVLTIGKNKRYYVTQRAYCIMSLYRYAEFYVQLINSVLNVYNLEIMTLCSEIGRKETQLSLLQVEVETSIRLPSAPQKVKDFIQPYLQLKSKLRQIPIQDQDEIIVEKNPIQKEINDLLWYAPKFLKLLTASQFYYLWRAMMSEVSILFISDELSALSAASIGLQCFLYPLKWVNPQITIVPNDLEEVLMAPFPTITGIQRSLLDIMNEETLYHLENNLMLVNIRSDNSGVDITYKEDPLEPIGNPYFNNLEKLLEHPFENLLNNENSAVLKIYDLVKYSLLASVFFKIPLPVLEGHRKFENSKDLNSVIVNNADERDRKFISTITKTQMFTYYVDSKYC